MTQQLARTDDGFQQAQETARDFQCGDCGTRLVVRWDGAQYRAMCARFPDEHESIRGYRDAQAQETRERLERDPQLAQAMVPVRDVPLTTQALRELSDDQLKTRIRTRFGDAFGPLHGQIMALAKTYGLDPVWDIMIYEDRPYVQYEGRLRKLREAPGYRGHKVRPLSKQEKEDWQFDLADIVIECDVDMGAHGHIIDYGVVYAKERERAHPNTPVAKQPQLIALKRAIGRASRQAVGIDLPTWDTFSNSVIEVAPGRLSSSGVALTDPEAEARKRFWAAARSAPPDGLGLTETEVHELLGVETVSGYPGGWYQALSDLTERAAERGAEIDEPSDVAVAPPPPRSEGAVADTPSPEPAAAPPAALVSSKSHPLWKRWLELEKRARAAGLDLDTSTVKLAEITEESLAASIAELETMIAEASDDQTEGQGAFA